MIKITEVVLVWFGGDLIFRTYIYVFCELGPVKKKRTYTYVVAKGLNIGNLRHQASANISWVKGVPMILVEPKHIYNLL